MVLYIEILLSCCLELLVWISIVPGAGESIQCVVCVCVVCVGVCGVCVFMGGGTSRFS